MNIEMPKRFRDKINFTETCWLWTARIGTRGYGQFQVDGKPVKAHRYSWKQFYGDIPEGLLVCHKCDVRHCVNPNHLFLGTHKDNTQDMVAKGRYLGGFKTGYTKGKKHWNVKLTEEKVAEIRRIYQKGKAYQRNEFSQYALAEKYGVSRSAIDKIVNNLSWKTSIKKKP